VETKFSLPKIRLNFANPDLFEFSVLLNKLELKLI